MTIQINKDWRIREASGDFFLERANENGTFQMVACYGGAQWALVAYVRYVLGQLEVEDLPTPADLISLLRKLTAEIEGATEGGGG